MDEGESRPCGHRTTMQIMGERESATSVRVSEGITKADLSSYLKNPKFPLYSATLASS